VAVDRVMEDNHFRDFQPNRKPSEGTGPICGLNKKPNGFAFREQTIGSIGRTETVVPSTRTKAVGTGRGDPERSIESLYIIRWGGLSVSVNTGLSASKNYNTWPS